MADRQAAAPPDAPLADVDDQRLLEALGERYAADILAAADEPRSARELSDQLDVPIATCYRRIEALAEVGLLAEPGRELSDRGRRTSVYRRTVEDVSVDFSGPTPTVSVTHLDDGDDGRERGRTDAR